MRRINFNDHWKFSKDNSTMMNSDCTEPIDVNLPHDAMICQERNARNPSGNAGGFFAGGNYLYSKTFELPESCENKYVVLEFEGVYHKARIYVNDSFAGMCTSGFRRFWVDMTPYMNVYGQNTVKVMVMNSDQPSCRWYTGGGIYRSVNLWIGERICIEPDGVKIKTPDVSEDVSLVSVEIKYRNHELSFRRVCFVTTIENGEGDVVAKEVTPVTLLPGKSPKISQKIYVMPANLWSLEEPNLYHCRVKIIDEQKEVLDESVTRFGIRKIQVDPRYGLRMNGKKILLRGTNIHHDNGILGAATFYDAEERRVKLLKKAGFNAIRMAHNPASVQLLDACDRMGMLVIDECFDMWNRAKNPYDDAWLFDIEWEKELEAIVKKDQNHPCVFMYCIGNEIQEIGTMQGAYMNRELVNKFHELDSTRFVTNAINGLMTVLDSQEELIDIMKDFGILTEEQSNQPDGDINDIMTILREHTNEVMQHPVIGERLEESLSALDISGYNYMRGRYEMDVKGNPNRILFGSETYPPEIDKNWKLVEMYPQVLGDFTWTGWDYLGEAGIGIAEYNTEVRFFKPYPAILGYCGDCHYKSDGMDHSVTANGTTANMPWSYFINHDTYGSAIDVTFDKYDTIIFDLANQTCDFGEDRIFVGGYNPAGQAPAENLTICNGTISSTYDLYFIEVATNGTLTLDNCTVNYDSASSSTMEIGGTVNVTISNSTITNTGDGNAVLLDGTLCGSVTINDSTINGSLGFEDETFTLTINGESFTYRKDNYSDTGQRPTQLGGIAITYAN